MTAYRVPAGAVVLDGAAVEWLAEAVRVAQRARARSGYAPVKAWGTLLEVLAANGHADMPDEAVPETEHVDLMTTADVAAALHVSERQARRLAPKLDGRRHGGQWFCDPLAVLDHLEGKQP